MGDQNKGGETKLLQLVQAAAISPDDARQLVANLRRKTGNRRQVNESETEYNDRIADRVADRIVARYSYLAGATGGFAALAGVVPGVGTLVAVGGALADTAICMKFQVDMCFCLAEAYGWDLSADETRNLSFLIAGFGFVERAAAEAAVRVGSRAGVNVIRQSLKGAALATTKQLFKRIGVTFTRKAAERAIPFGVGVLIGGGANYGITRYIGAQAKKWFILDRELNQPTPPEAPAVDLVAAAG